MNVCVCVCVCPSSPVDHLPLEEEKFDTVYSEEILTLLENYIVCVCVCVCVTH